MADSTKTSETRAGFEPFTRFPPEIRQDIWGTAASSPTLTPGVCFYTRTSKEPSSHLIVYEPRNSALLLTNTEAHDSALSSTRPTRDYNPQTDILYITGKDSFYHFMGNECGYKGSEWITAVRYLALPFSFPSLSSYLRDALARLSSLDTISIVFPNSPGTFNFDADLDIPADKSSRLKFMKEKELRGLTIKADYVYSTWMTDVPVRWSHNGLKHMQSMEQGTDRDCRPGNAGDNLSPLWDHRAQRLKIRWEARCFQS